MKLEILILTSHSRREMLRQLLSLLEPQIGALGIRKFDQVDLMICYDDQTPGKELGDKRESMRKIASGDYICFFDSDDLPAPYYIEKILPLLGSIDQIGFNVKAFDGTKPLAPTFHSLRYGVWSNDEHGYYRDISHLNPMRRELALQRPMGGGVGEDHRWADAMRGLVKTEHYIDRIMYYYLSRPIKKDIADAQDPFRLKLIEDLRGGLR